MLSNDKFKAYAAWAAVCFFWGTTYLGLRVGLETMPPFLLAGLRFLTAGGLMFGFLWLAMGAKLPHGREWFNLSLVGVLLLGVGTGAVVWAEQWVPSGIAALLVATAPFWTAGFEFLAADGERPTWRAFAGMLLGFGGLALLVAPQLTAATHGTSAHNNSYLLGVIALQIGCATWCGGSAFAKRHPTQVSPMMGAAVQMLAAGMALTVLGTLAGEWPLVRFNGRSLTAFWYLVIFGSLVAYSAYNYVLYKLPLPIVTLYAYINPIIAVFLGWFLLSEPLTARTWVALAIILGGVALVKTAPLRRVSNRKPPANVRTRYA